VPERWCRSTGRSRHPQAARVPQAETLPASHQDGTRPRSAVPPHPPPHSAPAGAAPTGAAGRHHWGIGCLPRRSAVAAAAAGRVRPRAPTARAGQCPRPAAGGAAGHTAREAPVQGRVGGRPAPRRRGAGRHGPSLRRGRGRRRRQAPLRTRGESLLEDYLHRHSVGNILMLLLQSFHKKPSTLAGSIVPSTSHMCLFCDATLSILVRRSRKSLKRDQSTIPGDAQRSRGTLS